MKRKYVPAIVRKCERQQDQIRDLSKASGNCRVENSFLKAKCWKLAQKVDSLKSKVSYLRNYKRSVHAVWIGDNSYDHD